MVNLKFVPQSDLQLSKPIQLTLLDLFLESEESRQLLEYTIEELVAYHVGFRENTYARKQELAAQKQSQKAATLAKVLEAKYYEEKKSKQNQKEQKRCRGEAVEDGLLVLGLRAFESIDAPPAPKEGTVPPPTARMTRNPMGRSLSPQPRRPSPRSHTASQAPTSGRSRGGPGSQPAGKPSSQPSRQPSR